MPNEHAFSLITSRCLIPVENIRGKPALFLENEENRTMLINQKIVIIGTIIPGRDENGNDFFIAKSRHTKDDFQTLTKGAAMLYIDLKAQVIRK